MSTKVRLKGLAPAEYVHPSDSEALASLKSVPGAAALVRKINEVGFDRLLTLESMANKIRVTPHQFPELYRLFKESMEVLDICTHVDLYIEQDFSLNAYAAGVEMPHVTITSELVNQFGPDELQFVIGHELGHIQCQHILYHQIGRFLPRIMALVGNATLGLGALVGTGLEVALYDWIRKSEFSADRAGLLTCQDPEVARKAFCRLAGVPSGWFEKLNLAEIQRQVEDFQHLVEADSVHRLYRFLGQMWNTHPWIIIRINSLLQWIDGGSYHRILRKRQRLLAANTSTAVCECGEPIEEGSYYCLFCGRRVAKGHGTEVR